jgi:hypothetical protein
MNRSNWVLLGFLAIAGFFLLTEHKAHVLGVLPFLLLLACPLLHLFHGHHGRHGRESKAAEHAHGGDGETK